MWWRQSLSLSASNTAGSLLALLWVLLGTLGVSVSLDTNSASMPHPSETISDSRRKVIIIEPAAACRFAAATSAAGPKRGVLTLGQLLGH